MDGEVVVGAILVIVMALVLAWLLSTPSAITVPESFKINLMSAFLISMAILGVGGVISLLLKRGEF